jgi:hypothetical protein
MFFASPFSSEASTFFPSASFFGQPVPSAATSLLLLAVLIVGCGENGNDGPSDPKNNAEANAASVDSLAHDLAARYLRLSYSGASLRSTHPLNDSLQALTSGKVAGGPVTLVDTFHVDPASIERSDSSRTVPVQVPAALTVSKVWKTSDPRTETTLMVQTNGKTISQAPRLVGWIALRDHILRVESDSGEAIARRLQDRWAEVTEKGPGV